MYVSEEAAAALPDTVDIAGCCGQIFKLTVMMCCCCCNEVGHKAADKDCPAHAPSGLQDI